MATLIVQADGGGDYTTIQAAINAVSAAGDVIEVRANTIGGSQTFTENLSWTISTQDGTSGNECRLTVRDGDTIALEGATAGGTRMLIQDTSFWVIEGFARVGANTWNNTVPVETEDPYECEYGIRVEQNSHHITIQNLGERGTGTNKVYGANNFTANQTGSFGTDDGAHHIKFYRCYFTTTGNNNNTGGSSTDFGDLLRIATPNTIIEECTLYQAGHNTLTIEEGKVLVRRCICDNDWTPRTTGADGYRAAAFAGDKNELSPGNIVSEYNVFRNGLTGSNPPNPNVKYQGYRLIARYDMIITGDDHGIHSSLNNGADGTVTECKLYNITITDTDSLFRQVAKASQSAFTNSYFEASYLNFVVQNLGGGDSLQANTYIYKDDDSDKGAYSDGWKGDEWRAMTVETAGLVAFNIYMDDDTGGSTTKSLANALIDWSDTFSNIDEQAVTFSDLANAKTSWDIDQIIADMEITAGSTALDNAVPQTTMVGSGTNSTSGTFADGRFFALLDTDLGLSYFGEQNDQVEINGEVVRLVTLNKDTGAATWDRAISWSNGDSVYHYDELINSTHTDRGAINSPTPTPTSNTTATRSGSWTLTQDADPSGSLTIASGDNRKLVVAVQAETTGQPTVSTFTVGGQAPTETVEKFKDNGSQDGWIYIGIWDEAAIAAMSGSTLSWSHTGTLNARCWSYATIVDCDQDATFTSTTESSGSNTFDVTTTSTSADDFIVVVSLATHHNRDLTDSDTLTEIYDASVSAIFTAHLSDGAGGDSTTTLTGDGTVGLYIAAGLVFGAGPASASSGDDVRKKRSRLINAVSRCGRR